MRKKPTPNKVEKQNELQHFSQQTHKDKEHKDRVADLYKDHTLPKTRKPSPKDKSLME